MSKSLMTHGPNLAGPRRRQKPPAGEEGYILIAVLFLAVMVLIALSIAAPKMAASIQRDREIELQHRGKQYVRAIKLYYKKFGAYPPSLDALEKTSEIRFLRKRYKDPMTGKADWHMIHFGEAKTPTAMGFFGQPLAGSTLAGIGPGGVGASAGGGIFGNSGTGGSGLGGSSGFGNSGTGFGSTTNSGTTGTGTTGTGTSGTGTGTGTTGTTGSSDGSSSSGSSGGSLFGSSSGDNQTFGGGGIIGVESTNPKQAILEYKKKKHFNEWEFVYDPLNDQTMITNNTGVGQQLPPSGGVSTPGTFSNQPTNTNLPTQQQQQQPQPTSPTTSPQ